jgi:TM2 domain-containing membrane protein YozV
MDGMAYGAPPGGAYGAPPGPPGPQPGFGAPPGPQPGFDPMNPMNPAAAMQPYGVGPQMSGPGMPGAMVAGGPQKSWMTTLLLAVFAGGFGVHRFYTGHTLIGVLQLVTCGGAGIWALLDIVFILTGKYTDAQGRPLAK